ncbi:MAG: hypothetical protein J7L23_02480 [Candidatus Diapherotrites archaeon]|nr:hypothetical protein [Candidatus Diapherotrites archaeon]
MEAKKALLVLKAIKPTKKKIILFLIIALLSIPLAYKHEKRLYTPENPTASMGLEFCFPSPSLGIEDCHIVGALFFELLVIWYLVACFIIYGLQKLREGLDAR